MFSTPRHMYGGTGLICYKNVKKCCKNNVVGVYSTLDVGGLCQIEGKSSIIYVRRKVDYEKIWNQTADSGCSQLNDRNTGNGSAFGR